MTRTFKIEPAKRREVPLLIGLAGASGSGKTYSAMRLATGIVKVTGGEIFVIDTEARRALHYADRFKFRHMEFGEPFGPLDYLDAIKQCVKEGAKCIVIDSMSHEHEGRGGVLEMHDQEVERLANSWKCSREKVGFPAWAKPKSERQQLINSILQIPCNFIFCFRAKEKVKPQGKELIHLGWMPIAGEQFIFEMTMNALLLPNSKGVPTWQSDEIGERQMIKLPEQFKDILKQGVQLSEQLGEQLAKWAKGDSVAKPPEQPPKPETPPPAELSEADESRLLTLQVALESIESHEELKAKWEKLKPHEQELMRTAFNAARLRISKKVTT